MMKNGEFIDLIVITMYVAIIAFLPAWYYNSRTDTYHECIDGKLYEIHDNTRDAYTSRRLIENTTCTQKETN